MIFIVFSIGCASKAKKKDYRFVMRPAVATGFLEMKANLTDKGQELAPESLTQVHYEPLVNYSPKITVSLWDYALTLSGTSKSSKADIAEQGPTTHSDFVFHSSYDIFGFDVYLQDYKGFHDEKSSTYDPIQETTIKTYYKYPDLQIQKAGMNLFAIWGTDEFNIDSAFNQVQPLYGTGLALMPMISMDQILVKNFSDVRMNGWPESDARKERYKITSVSLQLGLGATINYSYFHNLFSWLPDHKPIKTNVYFNLMGFYGPSYQREDDTYSEGTKEQIRVSLYDDGGFYFYGLQGMIERNIYSYDLFEMTIQSTEYELFAGFRL
jgi:hypothetical protein